ncbi:unnamed protein product [Rotaria magnacalcarata]|uniref:Uncharacterized protein n=1 Tax=Rotaria magnacalcarata TaxID=392030 RepID=A0A816VKC3_9BILA|nr:unnamed protein product [Rotaria magnacalcarata]CAF1303883.1 unnamed protein product [Rotaria magnacalcarata]CAF2128633.1 unnamed protein product [Rotaria magnacalcarata]CAF2143058.1 unnamed protein product [Rotaria magnacalcarata]CAF2220816.1 unnamed protein product [Rotaria magnacalcarata]
MSYWLKTVLKPHVFNCKNKSHCKSHCQCCAPAFSIQSHQRCSTVCPPLFVDNFRKRSFRSEHFRLFYERGDLPCTIHHRGKGQSLKWFIDNLETLNIDYYLPIFTDGLCEIKYPYSFIALQGILDLIEHASHKIGIESLSKIILPLKRALYTNDQIIISRVLIVLQKLACGNDGAIGVALVPYFNQILPMINIIKERNQGKLYQKQRQCKIVDDYEKDIPNELVRLIDKTLIILEQYGGQDAFINIKFSIPTYEQQADVKTLSTPQINAMLQPFMES